jgi:hypothetical protein
VPLVLLTLMLPFLLLCQSSLPLLLMVLMVLYAFSPVSLWLD